MSGIVASFKEAQPEVVDAMLSRIQHRGPDSKYIVGGPGWCVGQAVIELNERCADATTFKAASDLAIAADAAVYNEDALRALCPGSKASGGRLILDLYTSLGPATVCEIDGIFAFVIAGPDHIFAARDALGVKPLYYTSSNGHMSFASEVKALEGCFGPVREFPPGHCYHNVHGFVKFFSLPAHADGHIESEDATSGLKTHLQQAVAKRMASASAGVLLSGGIDSSVVAALARECTDRLDTFSVGTVDSPDLPHARAVADALGARHHERIITDEEMLKELDAVIYHLESFDALLVRSSVANYLAAEMAGDYVKVLLCGEGSDELFGGYDFLKDADPLALNMLLGDLVGDLHSGGLVRVDRMNMAHGVEPRVPFLDLDVVRFSLSVDPRMKIRSTSRGKVEKWILREAFSGDLPESVVWRRKEKFFAGAGSETTFLPVAEHEISDEEFQKGRCVPSIEPLASKEELLYYRRFESCFGSIPSAAELVGRTPAN